MSMDMYKYEKAMKRINASEQTVEKILAREKECPENMKKIRFRRPAMSVLAAAAAVVVSGTLVVSALGIVDLGKTFGRIFKGDVSQMESMSDIPEIKVTGDDRLSFTLLGIGGTKNDVAGTIEIRRTDGGTFPDKMIIDEKIKIAADKVYSAGSDCGLQYDADKNVLLFSFRFNSSLDLIGENLSINFKRFYDEINYIKAWKAVPEYDWHDTRPGHDEIVDQKIEENYKKYDAILLEGDWTVEFPLNYNTEYRLVDLTEKPTVILENGDRVDPNKVTVEDKLYRPTKAVVTTIGLSPISIDINFEVSDTDYFIARMPETTIILSDGEEIEVNGANGSGECSGLDSDYIRNYNMHVNFSKIVDIDSIEAVKINDDIVYIK